MTAVDDSQAATASGASVQCVDRALTILEMLARAGEAGVTEIAAELGVHKTTAFRLVATLESHRLVEQDGDRGRYRLGVGILRLAGATTARLDLVRRRGRSAGSSPPTPARPSTSPSAARPARSTSTRSPARRALQTPQLGRPAHPAARDQQRQGAAQRAGRGRPQGRAPASCRGTPTRRSPSGRSCSDELERGPRGRVRRRGRRARGRDSPRPPRRSATPTATSSPR